MDSNRILPALFSPDCTHPERDHAESGYSEPVHPERILTDLPFSQLVLLIEDNPICAKLFKSILTYGLDCRVYCVRDGRSARAFLAQNRPDAIQMEIQLPDESGWDLIRSFKMDENLHDIPIYVVTACGLLFKEEHLHERAMIAAEMEKPVTVSAYVSMVRRVLWDVDASVGRGATAVA
jgi:CheY-like chemotaxis protein